MAPSLPRNGEPTEATPTGPNLPPGAKDNFDPVYNVCRGTDPRCYHAWVSDRQNKVLLYTRTAGPRHANIKPALGPGLDPPLSTTQNVAQRAIKAWLEAKSVVVHWTEDVDTLARELGPSSDYKAVIFLNNSRDAMWKHGTASSTPLRPSTHARRRISTPQRRRCGSSSGPAAASSEFTTRSAPSTTGTGTRACSATPTISTMARTRTASSRSSPSDSSTSGSRQLRL